MNRILEALKQIEARRPPPVATGSGQQAPQEKPPAVARSVETPPVVAPALEALAVETPALETPPVAIPSVTEPAEEAALLGTGAEETRPPETPGERAPAEEAPASEESKEQTRPAAPEAQEQATPQEKPATEEGPRDLPRMPAREHDAGYRELAANILAALPPDRPVALLLTGAGDGAGTTTTLAPLAALLAERVSGGILAVDCNLRRPQLADQFGLAARRGLRAVLCGTLRWQETVRWTGLEGLRILPALAPGPDKDGPTDLSAVVPLLDELRQHYRLVLLDAASLAHPELAPLVRACDGTCLVVRLGQTTSGETRAAVRAIHAAGGRLLGCIVRDSG